MKQYGLIGKQIQHSFSPSFFAKKFKNEGITDSEYHLFPLEKISDFNALIDQHPTLKGLNVTIPYKTEILPYLDKISPQAASIGAVNTIKFAGGLVHGFNTDVYGFQYSLASQLSKYQYNSTALILGAGGASKAVVYALNQMGINYKIVSRKKTQDRLTYSELKHEIVKRNLIIINTTPLGMYPEINSCPNLPYEAIGSDHLLFDLVYNPTQTRFMKNGIERGAKVVNGIEMLYLQAEKSWEIWQE
ncbi:MAG: shikimate dehydrogenase [Saprospiraceae bacterium]|nr:shikimate dehydrogenase [Saprospiraceae bacterium]